MKTFSCVLRIPGCQAPPAVSDTAALQVQGAHCALSTPCSLLSWCPSLAGFSAWAPGLPLRLGNDCPLLRPRASRLSLGTCLELQAGVSPTSSAGLQKAWSRSSDFYTRVIIICSRVSPAKRGQALYAWDEVSAVTSYRMKEQKN